MAIIVAMDIGGTFVKHALIEDGMLRSESVGQFPINEKGTIQDIPFTLCDSGAAVEKLQQSLMWRNEATAR